MAVTVEIHPQVLAELEKHLTNTIQTDLESFKKDLAAYLEEERTPWYFGKDFPLTRPPAVKQACLMHLHVYTPVDKNGNPRTKEEWSFANIPQKRVRRQIARTSDTWVIYCRHIMDRSRVQVVGFADPNAHEACEKATYALGFADLAEEFHGS